MGYNKSIFLIGLLISGHLYAELGTDDSGSTDSWTYNYIKRFTELDIAQCKQKNTAYFVKRSVKPFTQLIFSWNAYRPEKGYFSFWAQAHDARTKSWSSWHKMVDWGAGVQKSYFTRPDLISQYFHVRLEMLQKKHADGFAIKIVAHNGADLSLLKSFAINTSDFAKFDSEIKDMYASDLSSVFVPGVPTLSQFEICHPRNDGLCSPTSCTMLTSYLLDVPIDPADFAEKAFDTGLDKYGSWPFNMAHAFERCQGQVYFAVARLASFKILHERLQQGIPVVVSVRGSIAGAPKPYPNGHLLVVVGYDNETKEVVCHDPAVQTSQETVKRYKLSAFLAAWERSFRLAYIAEPLKA